MSANRLPRNVQPSSFLHKHSCHAGADQQASLCVISCTHLHQRVVVQRRQCWVQLVPFSPFWECTLIGLWPSIEHHQHLLVLGIPCSVVWLPAVGWPAEATTHRRRTQQRVTDLTWRTAASYCYSQQAAQYRCQRHLSPQAQAAHAVVIMVCAVELTCYEAA